MNDGVLCTTLKTNKHEIYGIPRTKLFKYVKSCVTINSTLCYDNMHGNFVINNDLSNNLPNYSKHTYFLPVDTCFPNMQNITYFLNGNVCGIYNYGLLYKLEEKCHKYNSTDYVVAFKGMFVSLNYSRFLKFNQFYC